LWFDAEFEACLMV